MKPEVSVYLSSRFARRDELRGYRDQLEAAGYVVTSSWLHSEDAIDEQGRAVSADGIRPEETLSAQVFAVEDMADVVKSDIFIAFTDEPGAVGSGRGGRHVELGIALVTCARIFIVGRQEHVFHWHPSVRVVPDWSSLLDAISEVAS